MNLLAKDLATYYIELQALSTETYNFAFVFCYFYECINEF